MDAHPNLDTMRQRAAEILSAEPDAISWFRYGATYVMSLLAAIDFYSGAGRCDEAMDAMNELKGKLGAADSPDTIAKNMLRLGVYWDEQAEAEAAASCTDLTTEAILDIVRTK